MKSSKIWGDVFIFYFDVHINFLCQIFSPTLIFQIFYKNIFWAKTFDNVKLVNWAIVIQFEHFLTNALPNQIEYFLE